MRALSALIALLTTSTTYIEDLFTRSSYYSSTCIITSLIQYSGITSFIPPSRSLRTSFTITVAYNVFLVVFYSFIFFSIVRARAWTTP